MDGEDIKVIGVSTSSVEEGQTPLITTDRGSLYATGNIILLQERDLPKLFKDNQLKINKGEDLIFVPNDVLLTWIGQGK